MLYKILLVLPHLSMIRSSLVVDSTAQRSVYVTDYCPKMKFCSEGAHVMCMYYNAERTMGPRCSNAQNISMTPELANKLLDVSNAVRSRITNGKEKGKNGEFLPRGYGIFRLNWDTELATFAQVLANQCVLRHDLCRATKRFPDPGQTAGLVRFSYPDWFPVSKSGNFTTPGMSPAKLLYATTQILKSWYGQKNSVSPSMITFYPDWTLTPNSQNGRLYLEMIYGSATHMGCGISAYTEYAFYDNNAALNYNSVQIICNYSARPRKGTAVYNTVPPGDTAEPFSRCGCPVGSEADDECLCQKFPKEPTYPLQQLKLHQKPQCPDGEVCDPTVVVLPIFTVEDAPPEKLITHESFGNTSFRRPMDTRIYHRGENNLPTSQRKIYESDKFVSKPQVYGSNAKTLQRQFPSERNIRPTSHHLDVAIRKRYFDKKHLESKQQEQSSRTMLNTARKRTSLFSRAAKFELPGSPSIRSMKQTGIKDVVPRKDFSDAKRLVNKYLNEKNNLMKTQYKPASGDKKTFDSHESLNNEHVVEHDSAIFDSQRKNNLVQPLFKDIIHEVKTTFNEGKAENKEYETFKNSIGSKHDLHEVFNILNATKSLKLSREMAKYQKVPTTETVFNTVEEKVIIQDPFLKQIVSNTNDLNNALNSVTEESDNKLMALLDTLEQEVKHIELRDKDKQLFDAKIRKIYGKVVGKSVNSLDLNINNTKSNEKYLRDDVQDSYVIKKSIQQDPKEEPIDEKYRRKKTKPDELIGQKLEANYNSDYSDNNKYRNTSTTKDQSELDKYDEKNLYEKRYNLRGMKHSDLSREKMRNRHHDYENDHEFGERKTYRNYDFDRNTISEDEPRYRDTENKYRNRNMERNRHLRDEEIEHRRGNDLEHRERGKFERYHRKDDIGEAVRNKNYYLSNDALNDDPLSVERRRFYQEKLENIERRLQMRNHKRRKDVLLKEPDIKLDYSSEQEHQRYARHVKAVTESVIEHLFAEIKKKYSNSNKKVSRTQLSRVAQEIAIKMKHLRKKQMEKIKKKKTKKVKKTKRIQNK